jgi:hypothetical protein
LLLQHVQLSPVRLAARAEFHHDPVLLDGVFELASSFIDQTQHRMRGGALRAERQRSLARQARGAVIAGIEGPERFI